MLKRADIKEGDVVAVGCSGSFPALNACVYAALETLKAKPIVIASASASQWGANVPDLMWLDMERILQERGIFETRSVAASLGGYEDRGLGMTEEGQTMVRAAIDRNGVEFIESAEFDQSVEDRFKIYRKEAGRKPIKAFINVGGGTVSTGRSLGKKLFHPGLNKRAPGGIQRVDGVAPRFIHEGVPVIHMVQIVQLAEQYGLPVAPETTPEVGEGPIFAGTDYNDWLVASVLVVILACLYGFIRSDIGFRLLHGSTPRKDSSHPEPMV
jgi:poly-gamma-glutamate system protein